MKTFYFEDTQFENKGIDHTRNTVRAIVLNDKNEVAVIHLFGDDKFGHRDYLETPGGGMERFETKRQALKREIKEELGIIIKDIKPICTVIDYYNLIHQRNKIFYFVCKVKGTCLKKLEPFEKKFFEQTLWVPLNEIVTKYKSYQDTPISILVKQREIPVFETLLANYKY